MNRLIKYTVVSCLLFMASCTTYHPMKIDQKAVDAALQSPSLEDFIIDAQTIAHPILPPITINLQDGLSPDEAAVLAVLTNPGLNSIRDEKQIASAELLNAGILPNPQLSASYDIPYAGNTTGTTNAYGLGLGWDITSLIGRKTRIAAAQSQKQAVDLDVAWQEWQTAESARLSLMHILWIDEQLGLLRDKKGKLEQELDILKKAVSRGDKTEMELAAAESADQQLEIDIADTAQTREQDRLSLNHALGLAPEITVDIQKKIDISGWPPLMDYKNAISNIQNRRPDLLALKMGYESQEAKLKDAVLSQFPKIGIDLNQASDTSRVITAGPGVSIDFPLFDRGQGRIAIEKATRRKLYDEYMGRIFDARADIAAIVEKIESGRKRIAITEKAVDTLERLAHTYKTALDQGNADILSFYQVQSDLIAKRVELVQLKQSITDFGVALEIASGLYFPINADFSNLNGKEK